jgi:hypothetical protein
MKSIDEPAECGIGQLLISTVVAALKHKTSVIAIQMHPQAISVYRVYLKNGEDKICCIECLYRKIGSRLTPHNVSVEELLHTLMILCKFYQ